MSSPTLPFTDLDAVDRLGADLAAAGYDADRVPALLGAGAHNALGRDQPWPARHVTAQATGAAAPLATLIRLFLLGTSEPVGAVDAALPSLGVPGAIAHGALEYTPGSTTTVRAAVDIRPHADEARSYLVVSDLDSDVRPGPVRADHVLGIGAASMMLARAVIRQPVERVLDIGTGCGIQALHCAGHARAITATDTNARALALAAATARLNGMSWDLRQGSLFEPVAGEQFDLIVSNPPFVISAGAQRFEYRDSGMAGDELCRRLVAGLHDHLRPGGTAQLLANWVIRDGADWRHQVGTWVADTGCDGWVVQREVAHPAEYVSMWLADTGESSSEDAAAIAGEWIEYFAAERITGIGMGSIALRRPPAGAAGGVRDVVFDELTAAGDELTGPEVDAFLSRRAWLAGRGDDELLATRLCLASTDLLEERSVPSTQGWAPVLHMLHRPGGPGASVQLDQWSRSLLAGCTGEVALHTQIAILASAYGLDEDALTQAVLPTIRTAVTRGLVHPVDE